MGGRAPAAAPPIGAWLSVAVRHMLRSRSPYTTDFVSRRSPTFSNGRRIVVLLFRRLWPGTEIVGGWCDNSAVIETQLDPRLAMVACLAQWRRSIIECGDTGLPDQVRDIESVSRMV